MKPDKQSKEQPDTELSTAEQALVKGLLDPASAIEVVVPDNIDPVQFWANLTTCCKAVKIMRRMVERLRPVIGRMLLVAQENPRVYQDMGYGSYEDFLKRGVCDNLGLSRSDAYEAKRVAQKWPSLTAEQYAEIGSVKMSLLCKAGATENSKTGRKLLEKARELSIRDLRTELEKKALIERGEFQGAVIIINTTQAISERFEKFMTTPEVQAYCETTDRGMILERMIEECEVEWTAQSPSSVGGEEVPEFEEPGPTPLRETVPQPPPLRSW